jgi:exonuclease VII small subunit
VQDEIRKLVKSGINAYQTAKALLAEAKAEVEQLIEGK